jgi:hypothetical protein
LSEHPPLFRLDAVAAGDDDERLAAHLEACESCAAYVTRAAEMAARFRAGQGEDAERFIASLETLSAAGGAADASSSADRGGPLETAGAPRRASVFVMMPRAAWIAAPLLAAAALLLIVRGTHEVPHAPEPSVSGEPSFRFKGKLQLAVVRDRQGDQSRVATEVTVRPGDRLRVEVGVNDTRPIEVGFLGEDGTWVLLLAPAVIEAGTHFSERAARFDDTPTAGWIVAGHPEDVARARVSRTFDAVSAIPVIVEHDDP